jgi:hypothetical protein
VTVSSWKRSQKLCRQRDTLILLICTEIMTSN